MLSKLLFKKNNLNNCIKKIFHNIYIYFSHQSQNRLSDLVAEHLDHLHYLNDILCLNISDLNKVLSEHLLHKLLVPLYVYSLMKHKNLLCQNQVCSQLIELELFGMIVI